jgi:sec-independent protein translocase protein TatA
MGAFSIWHIVILAAVAFLLFGGRGKISDVMGDFAKGIKSFKKGLAEDDQPIAAPREVPTGVGQQLPKATEPAPLV